MWISWCKNKSLPLLWGQIFNCNNSLICRFNWTTANEIVYFTSHGIEIYNVQPDKRTVKSVRYMNQLISWLVFCPFSSILVLSASKTVSSLILFHLKNGNAYKLPKIDVDEQQIQNKVEVKEKDIQGRFFLMFKVGTFNMQWFDEFLIFQKSLVTFRTKWPHLLHKSLIQISFSIQLVQGSILCSRYNTSYDWRRRAKQYSKPKFRNSPIQHKQGCWNYTEDSCFAHSF